MDGTLELIVGPSGVGKSTLAEGTTGAYWFTTRPKRLAEESGTEKIFIDLSQYLQLNSNGQFLLNLTFDREQYGLHRSILDDLDNKKKISLTVGTYDTMLRLQGLFPQAHCKGVFALPSEIDSRLRLRGKSSSRISAIVPTLREFLQRGLEPFDEIIFNFHYERRLIANNVVESVEREEFDLRDYTYLGRVALEIDFLAQRYRFTKERGILENILNIVTKTPWAFGDRAGGNMVDHFVYALDPSSPEYKLFVPVFVDKLYTELEIDYDRSPIFLYLHWLADTGGQGDFISYYLAEAWWEAKGMSKFPGLVAQTRTPNEFIEIFNEFQQSEPGETYQDSRARWHRLFLVHNLSEHYLDVIQMVPLYLRQGLRGLQESCSLEKIKSLAEAALNYHSCYPNYYSVYSDDNPLALVSSYYKLLRLTNGRDIGSGADIQQNILSYVLTRTELHLLGLNTLNHSEVPLAVQENVFTVEECNNFRKKVIRILPVFFASYFNLSDIPEINLYASIEPLVLNKVDPRHGMTQREPQLLNRYMFGQ